MFKHMVRDLFSRRLGRSGCGPHGGHARHGWREDGGPFGGSRRFGRSPLHALFDRLDTTTSQEKVIREAIDEARAKGRDLRSEARGVRDAVADALASETFDERAFAELVGRVEERIPEARLGIATALATVHAALTPEQRKELASMVKHRGRHRR